jgi:ribonuclease T2
LALGISACSGSNGAGFDYYLLSLSWSPEYCAETQRSGELQCERPFAFVAHGLWPQNEQGYPRECPRAARVSEATIERMLPIMPSRGLVIHEWRAHGACTGLGANAYFDTVERAYRSIDIPPRFSRLDSDLSVDGDDVKQSFVDSNRQIPMKALALACNGRYLQEVRVCMDRSLSPRACGRDISDHCGSQVVFRAVR